MYKCLKYSGAQVAVRLIYMYLNILLFILCKNDLIVFAILCTNSFAGTKLSSNNIVVRLGGHLATIYLICENSFHGVGTKKNKRVIYSSLVCLCLPIGSIDISLVIQNLFSFIAIIQAKLYKGDGVVGKPQICSFSPSWIC